MGDDVEVDVQRLRERFDIADRGGVAMLTALDMEDAFARILALVRGIGRPDGRSS